MKNNEKLKMTDSYPTKILPNFAAFLMYIENNKVPLTKASQNMTRKDLREIDTLFTLNKPNVPPHSNQEEYPVIQLFFHLALELDLIRKSGFNNQVILTIHKERLSSYKALTDSEKYVSLLEAFWTKIDWQTLQRGRRSSCPDNIDILFEYVNEIPSGKVFLVSEMPEIKNSIADYDHFLFYFSYFGFWEFTIDEEISNQPESYVSAVAKTMKLTPLLKLLINPLIETWAPEKGAIEALDQLFKMFSNHSLALPESEEEDAPSLLITLKPFFKKNELNHLLQDIIKSSVVKGNYTLKVQLNSRCWRSMRLSSSHTLLDLHYLIQDAFQFDDDHLFAFYMDGKRFSSNSYHSRMDFSGPYADEAKIGELKLYEGKRFLYLFDFGDEWLFDIDVIQITEGKEVNEAVITKSVGESPEQYDF